MLQSILYSIFFYWLIFSLFAYYNVRKILFYYKSHPNIQIKPIWKGLIRSDFGKWDQKSILIGCFTRFAYNVTFLGFWLVCFVALIFITKPFGQKGKNLTMKIQKIIGNFAFKRAYNIVNQQDYNNFKADTPIIISNHINWFDIWYLGLINIPMSIVSKAAIKTAPVVGHIADFFDTLYVQRQNESKNNKSTIVQQIKARVDKFMRIKNEKGQAQQVCSPIVMFPQGTTSNGNSILTFKLGAFNDLAPITMFILSYKSPQFEMGMGDICQSHHAMISLCLHPTLRVQHVKMVSNKGQTPQQYAQRCRKEMSRISGYQIYQCGYRDSLEYQHAVDQARKLNKNQ